eukprot:614387_1
MAVVRCFLFVALLLRLPLLIGSMFVLVDGVIILFSFMALCRGGYGASWFIFIDVWWCNGLFNGARDDPLLLIIHGVAFVMVSSKSMVNHLCGSSWNGIDSEVGSGSTAW